MKRRFFGIYGKVFFYTLAILLFAICVTVLFFAGQIGSVVERAQQEQLAGVFSPLVEELRGKTDEEAAAVAAAFHAKNTAFDFSLSSKGGEIVYQTEGFEQIPQSGEVNLDGLLSQDRENDLQKELFKYTVSGNPNGRLNLIMATDTGGRLFITGKLSGSEIYAEYIEKTVIALGLILLVSIVGAALFARRIAGPIRQIASDTKHMAQLKPVTEPKVRKDEIGELAADVYSMYEALKLSIAQLETEIAREREMEENQRYFFSAASHELKTPIAAMSALIEEMMEGMVDAEERPEYLRRCMKMIAAQKKLIAEILEIVRLSGDMVVITRQDIELQTITDAVLLPIIPLSEGKAIALSSQIPNNFVCKTDEKMFQRVLSNILMNAVQNTPEQGEVRIWAENKNDDILFCISNTGEQIDEEMMSKLFEPFFRLDSARSRSSGHSGLGLTIVKRTLDRLEIPFSLENTEDGVLFWMRLPKSK